MVMCPHCSKQNKDDAKNCKYCGTRLAMTPTQPLCRKCGAVNPTSSRYCNRCGEWLTLSTGTAAAEKRASVKPPVVIPPTPAQPAQPPRAATLPARPNPLPEPQLRPHPAVAEERPKAAPVPVTPVEQPPAQVEPQKMPDWLTRLYGTGGPTLPPQSVPTHELLQVASAVGIEVDYSTLRFWQKRGLVPSPIRGPISGGRGTRGYYDRSLVDRLAFIRTIQKNHAMDLEAIRRELDHIDKKASQNGDVEPAALYKERLTELQKWSEAESRRTLCTILGQAVGISPEDIVSVTFCKKNGETLMIETDKIMAHQEREHA